MEISISVVSSCVEKIGKDIVGIGSTDKLTYRKSHKLCELCRKNISKIAGRYANVYGVTKLYFIS